MIISEKFKHFKVEWDMENPDNILIDAYDVSYDTETDKLIEFVTKIAEERIRTRLLYGKP